MHSRNASHNDDNRTVEVTGDDGRTYTIPAPPAELARDGARILDSVLYMLEELEALVRTLRRFEAARSDAERRHEDGRTIYEVDAMNEGWSFLTGNAGIYDVLHALADLAADTTGSVPVEPYQRPTARQLRAETFAQMDRGSA